MEDKFIVLTHEMIRRTDLTMQEKIIYIEILNLSSLDLGCVAANSHFEKSFGISKKSVSNTISNLVKKGLITSELSERNHKRLLSIKDGGVSIKDGGVSIKDGESKENISINKTINIKKYKKRINYSAFPLVNQEASNEWFKYKKYKTQAPITKTLNFLSQYSQHIQQQIINASIMNGYQGLFEPKQKHSTKKTLAQRNREAMEGYAKEYQQANLIEGEVL